MRTSAGALYIFYSFLYIAEGTLTEIFAHMNDKRYEKNTYNTPNLFQQSPISMESYKRAHTQTHTQKNNNRSTLAPDSDIR